MAKFIGSRSRSKEGPRHVTGRGLYTDDFILPGMLQAMILRSPHAHAEINSVDPSEALKNPNVIAVVTPDDVKQRTKPFKPGRYAAGLKRPIDEYAGAIEKVRYVGEPIGAVAARDRGTAEGARDGGGVGQRRGKQHPRPRAPCEQDVEAPGAARVPDQPPPAHLIPPPAP